MGGLGEDTRAALMADSIASAARAQGIEGADFDRVNRAYALAMEPRVAALKDDHHPAYLHPGRSVLILLQDVGPLPGTTLAVAAVLESEDEHLRLPVGSAMDELGEGVAASLRSIPFPGDGRLTERLIGLERGLALAALAERLDHLRHLHLRADLRDRWTDHHEEVATVWLPFAERTHPKLGTRFAHWARTFERRI